MSDFFVGEIENSDVQTLLCRLNKLPKLNVTGLMGRETDFLINGDGDGRFIKSLLNLFEDFILSRPRFSCLRKYCDR